MKSIIIQKAEGPLQYQEKANAGVSGDTSTGGLRSLDWRLKERCDVLILALGANDGLRGVPVQETMENLRAIVAKAKQRFPRVHVLIAGMLVPPNMGTDYSEQYRTVFPRVAKETGSSLMPFLLEAAAGAAELNQAEGKNLTAEGQRRIAQLLEPQLVQLLKEISEWARQDWQ